MATRKVQRVVLTTVRTWMPSVKVNDISEELMSVSGMNGGSALATVIVPTTLPPMA